MSVSEIFSKARTLVLDRIRDDQLNIEIEVPDNVPDLFVDRRAVRQIIMNLLVNAVKFTPDGGRVCLTAHSEAGDWVTLAVEDTGCGIPVEDLDRVTQPFVQVDSSYTRMTGGTGLGLSLVKSLTELHGGSLKIDSAIGEGTKVSVSMPSTMTVIGHAGTGNSSLATIHSMIMASKVAS